MSDENDVLQNYIVQRRVFLWLLIIKCEEDTTRVWLDAIGCGYNRRAASGALYKHRAREDILTPARHILPIRHEAAGKLLKEQSLFIVIVFFLATE